MDSQIYVERGASHFAVALVKVLKRLISRQSFETFKDKVTLCSKSAAVFAVSSVIT